MRKTRRKIYDGEKPFKLSRSKIDLFRQCPCCFYLDRKLGLSPPGGPPFTLNNAIDELWKREFDNCRAQQIPHPLAQSHGITAVPFQHDQIDDWRNNRRGLTYLHEPTQLIVSGALDEIWITSEKELIVVDVKATSKLSEISLDADWQIGYKKQIEVYQWLLQQNGFSVSNRGYFVYCNGRRDTASSVTNLYFDISLIPYDGEHSWIVPALFEIRDCLESPHIPTPAKTCKLCAYRQDVQKQLFVN